MSPLCLDFSVLLFVCLTPIFASLHPKENDINNDTSVCGSQRIFIGTSGVIKSPGFPNRYPLNVFCSYHIVVAEHLRIELRWNEFDVDGDMPGCNSSYSDFVQVYVAYYIRRNETKRNETKRTKRKVIFNETNETSSISQKPLARSNGNYEIRVGGIDFHL